MHYPPPPNIIKKRDNFTIIFAFGDPGERVLLEPALQAEVPAGIRKRGDSNTQVLIHNI
jgi:hypothetical protein